MPKDGWDVRVGCDVQSVAEIRAAIEDAGERYLMRVLSGAERHEAGPLDDPELVARYTSGRFAAKEAVYKALRGRPDTAIAWPQIEVLRDPAGAPLVRLSGGPAVLASREGIDEIAVSISHAAPFAFAVATAIARDRS